MIVYLASPSNQLHADKLRGMPVLISYATYRPFLNMYQQTFRRILVDSGAFSVMNSGKQVDIHEYFEWAGKWCSDADAVAGLDDIEGDWKKSLKNYELGGFPTFHDTDPPELLDDLIPIARERYGWIGIGLKPPRHGKERFIRAACDRIPDDLHVHGWALRAYTHIRRLDSVDSTNWLRRAMQIRTLPALKHLTYAECLEIVVKQYVRWKRTIEDPQPDLLEVES